MLIHPFCGPERCPSCTLCGPQGLNPAIVGLILDSTLILVFTFLNPERPFFRWGQGFSGSPLLARVCFLALMVAMDAWSRGSTPRVSMDYLTAGLG